MSHFPRFRPAARLLLVACALIAAAAPAGAGRNRWSPIGPPGGLVLALAAHPDQGPIYAAVGDCGTGPCGVYRSDDGAAPWVRVLGPVRASWHDVEIAPDRPATVFAASPDGLFRSEDGGAHWARVLPGASAVAAGAGGAVYAVSGSALYASADFGTSWTEVLVVKGLLSDVAVDPEHPQRVFVGGFENRVGQQQVGGVWRSDDGGATWQHTPLGVNCAAFHLAAAPGDPGVVYAAGCGLRRSRDGGATWEERLTIAELPATGDLALDPDDARTLYLAAAEPRVSRDEGESWEPLGAGLPDAFLARIAARRGGELAASPVELGIWTSADGGESWRPADARGLPPRPLSFFRPHPRQPGTLYVSARPPLLEVSADWGRTWSRLAPFPGLTAHAPLNDLAFDRARPRRLYATTPDALYRSDDEGRSWSTLRSPGGSGVAVVDTGTLLLGRPDAIERSADGGRTWQAVRRFACPLGCNVRFHQDPRAPRIVYAQASGHHLHHVGTDILWRSGDGGRTWRRLVGVTEDSYLRFAMAPSRSSTLYLIKAETFDSKRVLLRSDDAGRKWRAVGELPGEAYLSFEGVSGLAVDAADPETVYAGTDGGVYRSTDGGATFTPVNDGLVLPNIVELAAHLRVPGLVYTRTLRDTLYVAHFTEP